MRKAAPVPFAARLRALLAARGWTAYRLARESGVTRQQLGRILSGQQQPGWETACRLADALGVGVERLR